MNAYTSNYITIILQLYYNYITIVLQLYYNMHPQSQKTTF
jgi:hypothetical protein